MKKLQQSSQSEWDFLALWSFLTIKPGNNAITAMPQSLMTTLKVNSSSRDVNCDKIQPVWQHMKLYGIRPKKAKNKKQTNKGKKNSEIKFLILLSLKYYVCGLHREHKVFYIKHNHFSQNVVTFNVNCNTSTP